VVPQLGVSEGKEFKMSSTDTDTIFQSSVDPSVYLIKLLSISRRLDLLLIFIGNYPFSLPMEEYTSNSQKSVQVTNKVANDSVCYIDRR
jgi:hypothetical protein